MLTIPAPKSLIYVTSLQHRLAAWLGESFSMLLLQAARRACRARVCSVPCMRQEPIAPAASRPSHGPGTEGAHHAPESQDWLANPFPPLKKTQKKKFNLGPPPRVSARG